MYRKELTFIWKQGSGSSNIAKVLADANIPTDYDAWCQLTAPLYSNNYVPVTYYHIEGDKFGIITKAQWKAIKPIREAGVNKVFIRPTYRAYGIYHSIDINRAEVLFEGTEDECRDTIELTRFWGDKEVDY